MRGTTKAGYPLLWMRVHTAPGDLLRAVGGEESVLNHHVVEQQKVMELFVCLVQRRSP